MPGPNLREACITEALSIIASEGIEKLSLREVARRLNVSHQAPYKHFQSREHILAEIVARAFASFAHYLDGHEKSENPEADMGRMGHAYLDYAASHPLEYRLMFGTPLPDAHEHPEMMRQAKHAFGLLCDGLRRKDISRGLVRTDDEIVLDSLFVWSGLHGFASIASSPAVATLELDHRILEAGRVRLFKGFESALQD